MTNEQSGSHEPSPEEHEILGISCPYQYYVSEKQYEKSQLPPPNGKHRWKYKCKNDKGNETNWKYTDWIYD